MLGVGVVCGVVFDFWVDWVAGSVSEELVYHEEFGGLALNDNEEEKSNAQFVFEHFYLMIYNLLYIGRYFRSVD